jgi:hypothetical protein
MTSLRIFSVITWIAITLMINFPATYIQGIGSKTNFSLAADKTKKIVKRPPRRTRLSDRGSDKCRFNPKNDPEIPLTALVDKEDTAYTISQSPTFLFHIAYESDTPLDGIFSLQENGSNLFPPIQVSVNGKPGIVKIEIPKQLTQNKLYHWSFAIVCQPKDYAHNIVVDGWVMVSPEVDPASKLPRNTSQLQRAELYKQKRLLLDASAILVKLRDKDPQAKTEWEDLLGAKLLDLKRISPEKNLPSPQIAQ